MALYGGRHGRRLLHRRRPRRHKTLAGAVDSQLTVRHRAWRSSRGADRSEVLDTIVDAITEARDASDEELLAVGVGIPSLLDLERGVPVTTVHLPLDRRPGPRHDVRAARRARSCSTTTRTCATIAEWRFGAARGASDVLMLTLGTGIGGGIVIDGQLVRGATGAAARARPHGRRRGRPAAGDCGQPRLPGGGRVRHRAGARGAARRQGARGAGLRFRARARARRRAGDHRLRSSPSSPTTATRRRAMSSR